MATVFCSQCGQQMDDQQKFCASCGKPTQGAAQNTTPQQVPVYGGVQQPTVVYVSKPKIPGRGLGIASMVLGIIGLVYSVISVGGAIDMYSRLDMNYEYYDYVGYSAISSSTAVFAVWSVLSVLALIFGCCSIGKKYKNGVSISGVVMGGMGFLLYVTSIIIVQTI